MTLKAGLLAVLAAATFGCTQAQPAAQSSQLQSEIGRYQIAHVGVVNCGFLKVDTATGRAWCRNVDETLGTYWYPLVPDEKTLRDGALVK